MAKRPRTSDELERHLEVQLSRLERAANDFDAGNEDEASLLALTIRVILYDHPNPKSRSKSLLTLLGRKEVAFVNTASPLIPGNQVAHGGLVALETVGTGVMTRLADSSPVGFGIEGVGRYRALLDLTSDTARQSDFASWWSEPVFQRSTGEVFSRRDLILTAADQDGGAHVDAEIEEEYDQLAIGDYMPWRVSDQPGSIGTSIPGAERAAVRQIAHEVLKTLRKDYAKKPELKGPVSYGFSRTSKPPPDFVPKPGPALFTIDGSKLNLDQRKKPKTRRLFRP